MRLDTYYADLHIHVGHSKYAGAVKVTASRRLTLAAILAECVQHKGIGIAGVVDCGTDGVRHDLRDLLSAGELVPVDGGGYLFGGRLLLIPAAEVEAVEDGGGSSHWIGYFPSVASLDGFADYLRATVTNMNLSSQQSYRSARELVAAITDVGGEPVPAHAFTPYKSLYGNAADSPEDLLGPEARHVRVLELGLSADAELADRIPGNRRLAYVCSSDAHSAAKIGREHTELRISSPNYSEVLQALLGSSDRHVAAYYGLDPRLGKYHRTYCLDCDRTATGAPPQLVCPYCGSRRVVTGVLDRIEQLAQRTGRHEPCPPVPERPPYYYQIPLEFFPGVGPRTIARLLDAFGNEMEVLHRTSRDALSDVVGPAIADLVVAARHGVLGIEAGGGGRYGRIST